MIFGRKLKLLREIRVSLDEASFTICDRIVNEGDRTEPIELLYHMNMGYPLLDEDSLVEVSSEQVRPRNGPCGGRPGKLDAHGETAGGL